MNLDGHCVLNYLPYSVCLSVCLSAMCGQLDWTWTGKEEKSERVKTADTRLNLCRETELGITRLCRTVSRCYVDEERTVVVVVDPPMVL